MTARLDDAQHHTTTESRCAHRARPAAAVAACATALVAVATALSGLGVTALLGLTVGAALLACAVAIDVLRFRLPNALVLPAGAVGLATAVVSGRFSESIAAAALASAPLLIMHIADRRAIGLGDVKFAGAAGALVGSMWTPAAMLIPLTGLVIAGVARLVGPGGARPFGPALFSGLATAVAAAAVVHSIGWAS